MATDNSTRHALNLARIASFVSSDETFENVMSAMQPAEELGGPPPAQYVALMERIAHEAQRRASNAREHLNDQDPMQSLQESPHQKAMWLRAARRSLPVGTRVRVLSSDVPEYVGATGHVVGYDLGLDGDWPLVCVKFDAPIVYEGHPSERDGFYFDGPQDKENEIEELLDAEAEYGRDTESSYDSDEDRTP